MSWMLVWPGTFVLALVIGLLVRRGHGWLVLVGLVSGLVLWMIRWSGDVAFILITLLVAAWSMGIGAGYLIRRIPPGSV